MAGDRTCGASSVRAAELPTLGPVRILPRSPALAVAALLALGVSCAGGEDDLQGELDALEASVEARAEEEAALVERIESLEAELAELTAPPEDDAEDPLVTLQGRLDDLEDQLTALEGSAATTAEATAAADAAAEAAATDLRATLDGVRTATDELRGEVEELRTLYGSLRDRLDRHDRGHP